MLVTTKYATESSFMIGNSKHKYSPYYIEFCRKIILTTDQDLIKDGVQAIDDEFSEWFVKNPSCESVEVIKECVFQGKCKKERCLNHPCDEKQYKIVFPKEELINCPKCRTTDFDNCHSIQCPMREEKPCTQNVVDEAMKIVSKDVRQPKCVRDGLVTEQKQETLEEAAERYAHNYFEMHETNNYKALNQGFKAGAMWQAERRYSEEEVLELLHSRMRYTLGLDYKEVTTIDWFEQFKKK